MLLWVSVKKHWRNLNVIMRRQFNGLSKKDWWHLISEQIKIQDRELLLHLLHLAEEKPYYFKSTVKPILSPKVNFLWSLWIALEIDFWIVRNQLMFKIFLKNKKKISFLNGFKILKGLLLEAFQCFFDEMCSIVCWYYYGKKHLPPVYVSIMS